MPNILSIIIIVIKNGGGMSRVAIFPDMFKNRINRYFKS